MRARELEAHLAIETDDNIARGMSPDAARAAARRKPGNVTLLREAIYDMNTVGPLETLRLDICDAWRQLRRRPRVSALAVVLLMLAIACGSLISLFLGELPARRLEFALRETLGAGRGRLLRQVSIESLLLSAAGGAAGLLLAHWLVQSFKAAADLPRLDAIRFDLPVALFSIVVAAVVGLAARLPPMWGVHDAPQGLRASASTYAASAPRLRRTLVAGQIALALVLWATAVLFGVSLRRLMLVDPGFDLDHVISVRVSAYASRYPAQADAVGFFTDLVGRVAALPGVTAAAARSSLPLTGSSVGTAVGVEGRAVPMAERPGAGWQTVTPAYFAAVGIPLRAGRDFTRADLARPTHQVVINEALARILFRGENPIGRRLASAFATGLAGLSVLLAAIGVYGLLPSTVAARMREFGIRRGLGSSSSHIVRLVFTEGAGLAAIGIPVGVALAFASGRLIDSQLFGVQATDSRVLAAVAAVLMAVGAAAAYVPARRAARIDPAIALRDE